MKKVIILIMTLLCALAHISAQNTYTARVVDATTGDALPMASVHISSSHSTITNQEGDFSIKAQPPAVPPPFKLDPRKYTNKTTNKKMKKY